MCERHGVVGEDRELHPGTLVDLKAQGNSVIREPTCSR